MEIPLIEREEIMAKSEKKTKKDTAPTPITPDVEGKVAAPTQEQIAAAQRLRAEHAVLKVEFADVSVAKAIAERERDQVIQRLQMAQQVIEKLTVELEAAKAPSADEKKTKDE
jgi:hypothetical protein